MSSFVGTLLCTFIKQQKRRCFFLGENHCEEIVEESKNADFPSFSNINGDGAKIPLFTYEVSTIG
eukprot:scaffold1582_cov318-Pavlova_lutheri.AAC.7